MTVSKALTAEVRHEIEHLHAFFQDWYSGHSAVSDLGPRFLDRMDPALTFIGPDGRQQTRDDLHRAFDRAHGAQAHLRIAVRNVRLLRTEAEMFFATYEEWQHRGPDAPDGRTARIATVIMTRGLPFRWLHVHETWLPDAVRDAGSFDF